MSKVTVYPDGDSLARGASEYVVRLASEAMATRGRFSVALSGGSTPRALFTLLATPEVAVRVDWPRVEVFWGDERCVPPDHPDSCYRMAKETLLDHVAIPTENIHRIRGEADPAAATVAYEETLRGFFGDSPRFDLILLGVGDDGHTASLFPGTKALDEQQRWVVANYVEKLAKWRITLTAPAINAAAHVAFLVSSAGKAERLREVLHGEFRPHLLPSQLIKPERGELVWLLDAAAAAKL